MGRDLMAKFISDEEMKIMEQSAPSTKNIISDDDMLAMEAAQADKPSELNSLARGAAQGVSFGFADELAGGVGAAIRKALGDQASLMDIYEEERNDSRKAYKTAEETNPKSYMGGQVGGAVGTALIPGLGGANIAKLAAQGAAQSLGSSEADLLKGDIAGAASDTLSGAGIGAASGIAGKLISSGTKAITPHIKEALGTVGSKINQGIGTGANKLLTKLGGVDQELAGDFTTDIGSKAYSKFRSSAIGGNVDEFANAIQDIVPTKLPDPIKKQLAGDFLSEIQKQVPRSAPIGSDDVLKGIGIEFLIPGGGKAYGAYKLGQKAYEAAKDPSKVIGGLVNYEKALQLSSDTINKIAPKMGKYGKILTDAAQRGGQSLAATHYVLQQTQPGYSDQFKLATGEGEDE